ncbi:MarR family winged helix-turn-helix transcriptional regulator [Luminiphilus sp.]|nr:MarR family winged helix-turn-helix transcriptional regulator [Luminiphilus sp.]
MSDLEDQVLTSLRRIIRATHLHSRKLEKQTGLTTPQLVIIQTVSALYDPTVSAIAHAASLSLATVTTILNRLERNGLVMRSRSATDRRRVIVTLTDAGATLCARAPRPLQDQFVDHFNKLTLQDKNEIVAALHRVAAMMDVERIVEPSLTLNSESVV